MGNEAAFDGFGEAATLYAKNVGVVDAMQALFRAEMAHFANALFQQVRKELEKKGTKARLHDSGESGDRRRRWWLSNKEKADTRAYAEHVYLWFGVDGAELIDPGILTAKAFVKEKFKDYKHQLAAMSEGLQLPENCRVCSATDGSLFAVEIRYGNSNPLDACLQPIALLLLKLRDEELNLPGRPQNLARQLCPEPAG